MLKRVDKCLIQWNVIHSIPNSRFFFFILSLAAVAAAAEVKLFEYDYTIESSLISFFSKEKKGVKI